MFLAMNRFQITPGFEEGFENVWRERDSYLSEVPGFVSFSLLKGPSNDEHTLYASHSVWESREAFDAWTQSDAFRKAHAQTSAPKGTYLGHPNLETFEKVV
ncbi:MAG: antibiotic biosynthesis monooxygenase [Gammaproteobacteria bacterium]|nr:antibiotic biosynthesis monooxygenase [Gammaproteobacteria bacterium]